MGVYAFILIFVFWGVQAFINDVVKDAGKQAPIPVTKISLYSFPEIWHNFTYIAGYFKIILGITAIIFITNEYNFRTVRQNIISGFSRKEFLFGKLLMVGTIAIGATLFLYINGIILGLLNTKEITLSVIFEKNIFLFAYLLELFAFLSLSILLGFLLKKSGFAILALLIYYYLLEWIIRQQITETIGDYFPKKVISSLIDVPNTSLMKMFGASFREYIALPETIASIAYTTLFAFFMYLLLRKRDL